MLNCPVITLKKVTKERCNYNSKFHVVQNIILPYNLYKIINVMFYIALYYSEHTYSTF